MCSLIQLFLSSSPFPNPSHIHSDAFNYDQQMLTVVSSGQWVWGWFIASFALYFSVLLIWKSNEHISFWWKQLSHYLKKQNNTYLAKWDRNLKETNEMNFSNGNLLVKTPSSHLPTPIAICRQYARHLLHSTGNIIDGLSQSLSLKYFEWCNNPQLCVYVILLTVLVLRDVNDPFLVGLFLFQEVWLG